MDVRNRMADVVKLRCNACQDFLKMVLKDGWQQELYDKARREVNDNTQFKNKYIATYEQMRSSENGIDNYSVNDMDVTLITELVLARFGGIEVDKMTRNALIDLRDDRNFINHSSENEEAEELYLHGLMALCNLKGFIGIVDKKETHIADEKRLEFRKKYIKKIDDLKSLLDDERIEIIQKEKTMRKEIQRVLDSDDPRKAWLDLMELYMKKYLIIEHNFVAEGEFMVCASDMGVIQAHSPAAGYFLRIKKDYKEFERKLYMIFRCNENEPKFRRDYEYKSIISMINEYIMLDNTLTDGMRDLIEMIKRKGYYVTLSQEGFYEWKNSEG